MLIEFSVTNFRSFAEKQTLSLVADSSKELEATHTFSPVGKAKLPRLLHTVGVYGANASGKSNLLRAMSVMRDIVLSSAKESQAGEPIKDIVPHALFTDKPTEFEIIFIVAGVRYQYGFAATRERITEEWLFAFPAGRSQQWLSRVYDVDSKKYEWAINATQVKGKRELWKNATRDNALFLSTAVQLNNEQLKPLLEWFGQNFGIGTTDVISPARTLELCKNSEGKSRILEFLNTADISVQDVELSEREFPLSNFLPKELPLEVKQIILRDLGNEKVIEVEFSHQTSEGKRFQLPINLESSGTRRLFGNAGAWLNILEKGLVICIDELEASLHPFITRFLVSLFHNSEINQNHAQLIFTTHDTTILDINFLRRDQIWFVEKDKYQSTHLYPLSDFSPRKNEALQKGYLQGRYGALPYISDPQWLK